METISEYLLESHLYDSITFQKFKEFFPARCRENPDLKGLYKEFLADRKQKRQLVKANVEENLDEVLENTLRKLDPAGQPIEEVIEILLIKEKELRRELRFFEETSDNYLKYFDRYHQDLTEIDLEGEKKAKIDLEQAKALTATLQQFA